MSIIEIAVLPSRPQPDDRGFLSTLKNGFDIQTKWLIETHPENPLLNKPASVCYKSVNEPQEYVIMAKWESLEAHWEWIRSKDNAKVMESLSPYLGNKDALSLAHIDASGYGSAGLPECPFVAIERLLVEAGEKPTVVENIKAEKESDRTVVTKHGFAGWRVDGEPGGKEEYVVISSWDEVDGWEKAAGRSGGHFGLAEASVKVYSRFL